MTEKICISCGTESPSHFEYCKHCGAILPVFDKIPREEECQAEPPSFGEISYDEYSRFVEKNSKSILDDFIVLENRRNVFCLPVLFLGLFFGFFGMSAWFFYRKLKAHGAVLFLIGTVVAAVHVALNAEVYKAAWSIGVGMLGGAVDLNLGTALLANLSRYTLNITQYITFLASFFISADALRFYKKASYKKILSLKEKSAEGDFSLDVALKKQGGVSVLSFILTFMVAVLVWAAAFMVCMLW